MQDRVAQLCLSYFLCRFDPRSKKRLTRELVRQIASEVYSKEMVDDFIDTNLAQFQALIVDEFNNRFNDGRPVRYQIADAQGIGKIVAGNHARRLTGEIRFQNSVNRLSPGEFEMLAAVILRRLGCYEVFSTPSSHDQGVDAFGHYTLVKPSPYGVTHRLVWIAQAKHYMDTKVTTGDVRELVGSKELLIAKAFSTVDERYRELQLRCYGPIAIALVTGEEIPTTVRRLADNAGIYVFASSDIFHLLQPSLGADYSVRAIRKLLAKEGESISKLE